MMFQKCKSKENLENIQQESKENIIQTFYETLLTFNIPTINMQMTFCSKATQLCADL